MTAAAGTEPAVLPVFAGAALEHAFASELPELGIPWQAAPAPAPRIVALNSRLAAELGLDPARLDSPEGAEFLVGRALATGSEPVAQLYAGHQFGSYSPLLGDGRALLLGEARAPDGRLVDLHLKGSGRTPPARGDGFAALGPMLREYLVGEAMHALGIPTSRALAVVATGRSVHREDFLRDDRLPGAVLARIAASHLRVGSFQYARAQRDPALLERLVDFALRRHYPERLTSNPRIGTRPALALFGAVVRAQAELVAQWMLVGFVHGVMNTDNVAISGETIDYGPCAFIDAYDPGAVFSSIDQAGRYAFGAQPTVAKWNLARFAESLLPLLDPDGDRAVALAEDALAGFDRVFSEAWTAGMRAKLGLRDAPAAPGRELAEELLALLGESGADYTGTFRQLTRAAMRERGGDALVVARSLLGGGTVAGQARAGSWLDRWLAEDPDPVLMARENPVSIPRNHLLAEALEAATDGDPARFVDLLEAVTHPYEERLEWARFAEPAPPDAGRFVSYCGT